MNLVKIHILKIFKKEQETKIMNKLKKAWIYLRKNVPNWTCRLPERVIGYIFILILGSILAAFSTEVTLLGFVTWLVISIFAIEAVLPLSRICGESIQDMVWGMSYNIPDDAKQPNPIGPEMKIDKNIIEPKTLPHEEIKVSTEEAFLGSDDLEHKN